MLKRLKVKQRLLTSYMVLMLLMLIISTLSILGLRAIREDLMVVVREDRQIEEAISGMNTDINKIGMLLRGVVLETNSIKREEDIRAYRETLEELTEKTEIIRGSSRLEGVEDELKGYEGCQKEWLSICEELIMKVERGELEKGYELLVTGWSEGLKELNKKAENLKIVVEVGIEGDTEVSIREVRYTIILIVVVLILSLGVSIILTLKVTQSIVIPVEEVSRVAEGLSKGYLITDIKYKGGDELGVMAESMSKSMETLKRYIKDIDVALETMSRGDFNIGVTESFKGDFENIEKSFINFSKKMSTTLERINEASEQVAMNADQVALGSQVLAQGSTEQSSSVEELSSVISGISEDIKRSAENARQANDLAQRTGNAIVESNEKMREMTIAMNDISEKAREISKIIKTIDDIAFQTNILALNAAVEASRAGSLGRGFAVVADEVRNLAQKSAEASKETEVLIAGTVESVSRGVNLVEETAGALIEVVGDATKVVKMMEEITESSEKQSELAGAVTRGIKEISAVVQTNSATAEESSASSEELNVQAEGLKELVGEFKLRGGSKSNIGRRV